MGSTSTPGEIVSESFIAALFYGIYISTFVYCMRCMLFTNDGWEVRRLRSIQWPLFLVTFAIFSMSTVACYIQLKQSLTHVYGLQSPEWRAIVLCTAADTINQLADAVLIYRLWKIYDTSYRIVAFPLLLWLGNSALTILQACRQVLQGSKHELHFVNTSIGPGVILTPFWASAIVLNVYATSLIIFRLRRIHHGSVLSMRRTIKTVQFVTSVIIESGSLYLSIGIAHFVVWWTPSDFAIDVVSNMHIPTIGIAFNLFIIRLAKHRAEGDTLDSQLVESVMQFEVPKIIVPADAENLGQTYSTPTFHDSSFNQSGTKIDSMDCTK